MYSVVNDLRFQSSPHNEDVFFDDIVSVVMTATKVIEGGRFL